MVRRGIRGVCLFLSLGTCLAAEPQADHVAVAADDAVAAFDYRVEAAPEWTALFYRKSGVFGTDGIFSIPLDGTDANDGEEETLIIFSDSYIGEVDAENKPRPGSKMVNNCVAYVRGLDADAANFRFHYKTGKNGEPQTFFVPDNPKARPDQYFWLGDGFVNKAKDGQLYLFAYHVEMTGPDVFDFVVPDVSLIALPTGSRPPFSDQRQIPTPLHVEHHEIGEGNFGAGVLVNTDWANTPAPDGFIYVYGCLGPQNNLVAARVEPARFEDFSAWRYWNGSGWDVDPGNVAAVTHSVSNELSVTALPDGRFLLVFQVAGISDKVGMRIGTSPVGPFGDIHELWVTPEYAEGLLPYNAKAHSALSRPGELLISYNTITADFWNDIRKDAHIYRPRFIRLVFE
ncbi:MAG: DUF4185 domain-containing protein [Planctomycetaceae bacterium]